MATFQLFKLSRNKTAVFEPPAVIPPPVSNLEQANAWEAFITAALDQDLGINNDILRGFLAWRWWPGSTDDDGATGYSVQDKPAAGVISTQWAAPKLAGAPLSDPVSKFGTFCGIDANGSGFSGATGNQAFWDSILSAPAWAQRDAFIQVRTINQVGDTGGTELAGIGTFSKRAEWLSIWKRSKFSMINNCELEVVNPIKGTDPKGTSSVTAVGTIGSGDDGAVWHETNKPDNARWRMAVMANKYPGAFPMSIFMVGNEPDGNICRLSAYAPGHAGETIGPFANTAAIDKPEAFRRLALLAKSAHQELKTDKRYYTTNKHPSVVSSYANTGGILGTGQGNAYNIYQFFNYNNGEMLNYCQVVANHLHNFAGEFDSPAPGTTDSTWHLWTAIHEGQNAAGIGFVHPIYNNEGGVRRGNDTPGDLESLRPPQQTQWNEPPTPANRLARQLLKVRRQGFMVCTIFYWAWSFWVLYNHNGSGDNGMIWCPSGGGFAPREPEWTAIKRQFNPSLYTLIGRSPWALPITAKPWADLSNINTQANVGFHDPATWAILGNIANPEKADPASANTRTWHEWDRATITNNNITFTAPVAGQGNQLNRAMRPIILQGHGRYYVTCDVAGNTGTARLIARGFNACDGLATTLGQPGSETTSANAQLTVTFVTAPHNVKNFPNLPKAAVVLECTKAAQYSNVTVLSSRPLSIPPLGAIISASPTNGLFPLLVSFVGSGTGGLGGYGFSWVFGDGGTATGSAVSHTYTTAGSYIATLTVTAGNYYATSQQQIIVTQTQSIATAACSGSSAVTGRSISLPSTATASGTGVATGIKVATLVVTAFANPASGSPPLIVTFSASSTGGTGSYSYSWTFGDSSSGTGTPINHTYNNAGTFIATVTATSGTQTDQDTVSVVVAAQSAGDISLKPFTYKSAYWRPVGTGATYAGNSHPAQVSWSQRCQFGINVGSPFGCVIYKVTNSSPLRTVFRNPIHEVPYNIPVEGITVRYPAEGVDLHAAADNNDSVVIFINTDTGEAHEFFDAGPAGAVNTMNMTAALYRPSDARTGLGHGTASGDRIGSSASGVSMAFGIMRHAELASGDPIQHVQQTTMPRTPTHCSSGAELLSTSRVLPATTIDGGAGGSTNQGNIPYGAIFAIPPADFATATAGLSGLALRFATQWRDYGICPVDGGSGVKFRADQFVTASEKTSCTTAFNACAPYMRYITNCAWDPNNQDRPTGGGQPIADNGAWDAPVPVLMGFYESSEARSYNVANNHNLINDMTSRGFNIILNYNAPGPPEFAEIPYCEEYADYCASKGAKVIWEMRYYAPGAGLTAAINALKVKPATFGYYVADEPGAGAADIIALNNAIKSLDPAHPTIAVLGWWYLRAGACGSGLTTTTFLDQVKNYADLIAIDDYPQDVDGDGNDTDQCEEEDMNEFFTTAYNWTKANGKRFGAVLQAYSPSVAYHGGTNQATWPTEARMRNWRDIVMTNSRPEFILWYSYFDIRNFYPTQMARVQAAAFTRPYPPMPA